MLFSLDYFEYWVGHFTKRKRKYFSSQKAKTIYLRKKTNPPNKKIGRPQSAIIYPKHTYYHCRSMLKG